MPPKWTFLVLWRDLTQIISWLILLRMWLEMGVFNNLLKYFCILEMRKVLKVPITINSISVGFNALNYLEVHLRDIRVKPPPITYDDRWELEDIVRVDVVKVSIPFLAGLYLYLCSWGTLMHVDIVSVHGLRFYIEGYREIDEKMTYNISLLGKKMEDLLPCDVDQVVLKNDMETLKIVENYFSAMPSSQPIQLNISSRNIKHHSTGQNLSLSPRNFVNKNSSLVEETPYILKQPTNQAPRAEHNQRVFSRDGLIKSAKEKIHNIYENAKHNLEERIYEKLNLLHVYVQGPEPVSSGPNIARTICRHVIFDYIEINLVRALPYQLRHIERRPLCVDFLQFNYLGYENLNILSTPRRSSEQYCFDCHESIEYPLKSEHNIICKRCNETCAISTPRPKYSYISPIEGQVQHGEDNFLLHNNNKNNEIFDHSISGSQLSSLFVDLFSISIDQSGLDIVVFKYWFERKLLFGVYKQNMKRLAQDILNFHPFQSSSVEKNELGEILCDNSISEKSGYSTHPSEKAQQFLNSNRGVVHAHPIFF